MQAIARTWGAWEVAAALQRQTPRAQSGVTVHKRNPRERGYKREWGMVRPREQGGVRVWDCAECGAIPCPDDYSDRMGAAF